jgi:chromosome segregation ATPase
MATRDAWREPCPLAAKRRIRYMKDPVRNSIKKQAPRRRTKPRAKDRPKRSSIRASDLPATRGMLQHVRSELKAEMRAGFKMMDARFAKIDARFSEQDSRFNQIDARFAKIDARFSEQDSRFNQIDARFETLSADVARIGILFEEQNANNRIVLEGLTSLWQRQDRIETRTDGIEELVRSLAQRR